MAANGPQDPLAAFTAVRRNAHRGYGERRAFPVKAADGSARFREDEPGGGVVPGHQAHLEIKLRESRGHQAQLNGSGAGPAHIVALLEEVVDDVAAIARPFLMISAQGGKENTLFERPVGDVDGLPVEKGPLTFLSRIELSAPGAVDDTQDGLTPPYERYADAAVLVSPGVVGRSVDGVDDPDGLVSGDILQVLFLAKEAHLGEPDFQLTDEEVLDGKVRRGDDILPDSLVVNLEPSRTVHQGGGSTDDGRDNIYINVFHMLLNKACAECAGCHVSGG